MKDYYFLSVIIPTYNNKGYLEKTIVSLDRQSYPKDKYEVIVVDDGSRDGTPQLIDSMSYNVSYRLRYFYQKRKGPAAARNLGVKNASGEIVVFTDSDCISSSGWLEEISCGYGDERVAGVGGTIKAEPADSKISRYCAYIRMNERPLIGKDGVVYLITGNASFRKGYIDLVGGFDERYNFPGGEDPDLCYRLKEKGCIFKYRQNAVVYNRHKEILAQLLKTQFNYGRGEAFLLLRRSAYWDLSLPPGNKAKYLFHIILFMLRVTIFLLMKLRFIISFFKIPLKSMSYYADGLSWQDSLSYSSLDFLTRFSSRLGFLCGYIVGKFKGFKRTEKL